MRTHLTVITALVLVTSMFTPCAMATSSEDAQITTKVTELIKQENDLPINSIEVNTHDGIVKLNGNLETVLQANRAVELAYSVEKVQDVDNNIEIKDSEQYIKDSLITARARGRVLQLARDGKISKSYKLHFETTNGNLHMLGEVGNKQDIKTLKKELVKVKGVKKLEANVWAIK